MVVDNEKRAKLNKLRHPDLAADKPQAGRVVQYRDILNRTMTKSKSSIELWS